MDIVDMLYRRLNGHLSTSDYIAWANAVLKEGCEIAEIAEMASFVYEQEPDAQEVERYFLRCMDLLGFEVSGDAFQATLDYWIATCERMLAGTLTRADGIALLHEIDNDHEYCLMQPWVDLSHFYRERHRQTEQFQPAADEIAAHGEEVYEWLLVRQFAALCRLANKSLAEKFPIVWQCLSCAHCSGEDTQTVRRTASCPACGDADSLKNMRYYANREAYLQASLPRTHAAGKSRSNIDDAT